MSKAAKATEPTFEEALGKLESIVETMESGDLPLDQLLARFEEGTRLARLCQAQLSTAELRIRQLESQSTGEIATSDLATDPIVSQSVTQ